MNSPAVIRIVDIQFGEGVSIGAFDVAEWIGQLFLGMLCAFTIEHGHFIG